MNTITLKSPHLQLDLKPDSSSWVVTGRLARADLRVESGMGLLYRAGNSQARALYDWRPWRAVPIGNGGAPHGSLPPVRLAIGPDAQGLLFDLTFTLSSGEPLVFWKVAITHQGKQPVYLRKIELFRAGFISVPRSNPSARRQHAGSIQLHPRGGELAFFSNGWQSWNHTGVYRYFDRARRTRLGPITSPMRVNAGTPQPRAVGQFSSDMFGVLGDRMHRTAMLLGFLSQKQHFGSLETFTDPFAPALRMWANGDMARLDPGATTETDWACLSFLHLDSVDPLGPYLEAVARQHGLSDVENRPIPSGWCSWYHYFQNISAQVIRENLQAAAALKTELPLEFIQIDDGFQAQVGDWLDFKPGFPNGPGPLAGEIQQAGFTPGVWLAPFIVHPDASLAQAHPEWLLRNRWGRPVNAGYIWERFTTALDLTEPGALDYTCRVVDTAVHKWGFPYLKLDFLYAAALPGRRKDPTRTRAQVLHNALLALRQAAGPQTTLLGCGCPLGSAIGVMDAMRIGADVAPDWHPKYFGTHLFFKPEPDFPSARNAIQNALTRAPIHRRWWINDPDCLLVRPDSSLTLVEVQTLATVIALTGGSLLLSDDLQKLPRERLEIARALLPLIGQRPHVLDWFDSSTPTRLQIDLEGACGRWHLLAAFNWKDRPADLEIDPAQYYLDLQKGYFVREFWSGEVRRLNREPLVWRQVPPHGCLFLAVRPRRSHPFYLGSNLHVSQGLEVSVWEIGLHSCTLTLKRPGAAQGYIDLFLPDAPSEANLDGAPVSWVDSGDGIYRLAVDFKQTAGLEVSLSQAGE